MTPKSGSIARSRISPTRSPSSFLTLRPMTFDAASTFGWSRVAMLHLRQIEMQEPCRSAGAASVHGAVREAGAALGYAASDEAWLVDSARPRARRGRVHRWRPVPEVAHGRADRQPRRGERARGARRGGCAPDRHARAPDAG